MRDALPEKVHINESAVINLDSFKNPGTHWVAYVKRGNKVDFFDSFGNLRPPPELIRYWKPNAIVTYNRQSFQNFNQENCGQLCIKFLLASSIKRRQ